MESKVRFKENEQQIRERCKHIFKHLIKKNTLKLLRQRHWKKLIFVMTKLISQDLEYGINILLSQLIDNKKGNTYTMELGLDSISEMMRVNGTFCKQHQISKSNLDKINEILPVILEECESVIGVTKLHKRETPLLIHYDNRYIDKYKITHDPTFEDIYIENFNQLLRINMDDQKTNNLTSENGVYFNDEEKQIYDEEKSMLEDINYKQIRDAQLLSLSFLRNDLLIKYYNYDKNIVVMMILNYPLKIIKALNVNI